MSTTDSPLTRITGLALAGIGLAHFRKPELFETITKSAYPFNTRFLR